MLDTPITDFVGLWSLVYVQPRCERLAASIFMRDGVQCYLPLYVEKKYYEKCRRTVATERPLFERYVFVCGDDAGNWYDVIRERTYEGQRIVSMTHGVCDQAKFLRELVAVSSAVASETIKPYSLPAEGDLCECVAGPWMGFVGIIGAERNANQVEFVTTVFDRKVSIKIAPHMLQIRLPRVKKSA